MTLYNITGIADTTTGVLSFTQGVNHFILNEWLGVLILISVGMIMFTSYMFSTGGDLKKTAIATSFIMFTMTFLMRIIGLVGDKVFFGMLILWALAVGFFWSEG